MVAKKNVKQIAYFYPLLSCIYNNIDFITLDVSFLIKRMFCLVGLRYSPNINKHQSSKIFKC